MAIVFQCALTVIMIVILNFCLIEFSRITSKHLNPIFSSLFKLLSVCNAKYKYFVINITFLPYLKL